MKHTLEHPVFSRLREQVDKTTRAFAVAFVIQNPTSILFLREAQARFRKRLEKHFGLRTKYIPHLGRRQGGSVGEPS